MWPFTARVNEKTAPIELIAAVAICRRLRDARGQIYAPPSKGQRFCRMTGKDLVELLNLHPERRAKKASHTSP
jgi:hypothetical protein